MSRLEHKHTDYASGTGSYLLDEGIGRYSAASTTFILVTINALQDLRPSLAALKAFVTNTQG